MTPRTRVYLTLVILAAIILFGACTESSGPSNPPARSTKVSPRVWDDSAAGVRCYIYAVRTISCVKIR